jgi:hypothetical protein
VKHQCELLKLFRSTHTIRVKFLWSAIKKKSISERCRFIVGWAMSNTMQSDLVVRAVQVAIKAHGTPEIMNTDPGSQFTSKDYITCMNSYKNLRIREENLSYISKICVWTRGSLTVYSLNTTSFLVFVSAISSFVNP